MRFRDHFGRPTLFFGFGELWNIHACRPDGTPRYMPQSRANPILYADATYIKRALAWAIDRPDNRRGEFVDDESVFHCFSSNHYGMDSDERAAWFHSTYPRMVRDHLGFRLRFSEAEDGWWSPEVARTRFWGWHCAVRRARERNRPDEIRALLQTAALLLLAGFNSNRDVLDRVLRRAHTSLLEPVHYV